MFYRIPDNLASELEELDSYIARFKSGEIDAATLKVRRVPFGCYEQRQDGTYMVRIRTTGGALTPQQLQTIAELSARYGSEAIHITTRQEFQIHDVDLDNVLPIMRALLLAGLASRGGGGNTVRNILVSPDAGVSPDEVFDPSPYAFALTSRLIAESDSWLLPRKYKIAFSNSAADSSYAEFNDLGLITQIRNGEKGFRVYVAGGLGTKPEVGHLLHDFISRTGDAEFPHLGWVGGGCCQPPPPCKTGRISFPIPGSSATWHWSRVPMCLRVEAHFLVVAMSVQELAARQTVFAASDA